MQPIDKPAVSLTFGGIVAGGVPWDCRLWFSPLDVGADIGNVNAGILNNAVANINALWGAVAPFNTPDTAITSLIARGYRAGQTATRVVAQANLGDLHIGTGGGSGALSQAIVASLYTDVAGRSGRGRLYWPATAGLPAGHAFSDAQCQSLANALAAFMVAISDDVAQPLEGNPVGVVRSETLGTANQIKTVTVNTRPDRQEHRERHLVTTAHNAAVVY